MRSLGRTSDQVERPSAERLASHENGDRSDSARTCRRSQSYPPNSWERSRTIFPGGDSETHCSKIRSDKVRDRAIAELSRDRAVRLYQSPEQKATVILRGKGQRLEGLDERILHVVFDVILEQAVPPQ